MDPVAANITSTQAPLNPLLPPTSVHSHVLPTRGTNNRGYRHPDSRGNCGRVGRGRSHAYPHPPPQEPTYLRDHNGTSCPSRGRTPNGHPNRDPHHYNSYNQYPRDNEYPMENEYFQKKHHWSRIVLHHNSMMNHHRGMDF